MEYCEIHEMVVDPEFEMCPLCSMEKAGMDKKAIGGYFVSRSHHDDWMCNRWCVWTPERTFLCACELEADASQIADALNRRIEQLPLFS